MIEPELVCINGNVITVDDVDSVQEAFAVKDGRFLSVGKNRDVIKLRGPGTEVIDLRKRTVLPGFIDAHAHLLSLTGKTYLQVDCSGPDVRSIDDIVRKLSRKASRTEPGKWILGVGYDDSKLSEGRHPTRRDLDRVSREHPVHIRHVSGHLGVVNSLGFRLAGIDEDTSPPEGGGFDRDADGNLNGVLREEADFLFLSGIARGKAIIPPFTEEEELTGLMEGCREFNRYGITSTGDALVNRAELSTFIKAEELGLLTVRVYMMVFDSLLPSLAAAGLRTGFGNDMVRIGPVKTFIDGAIAGRTAWLSRPYENRPDDYGIQTKTFEELEVIVGSAHEAGFQVAVHANGDRAIETTLDVYEKVLEARPRPDHRHRIEHCTVVTPRILERIKNLGVVVLPFSTYVYQHGDKMGEYGSRIGMMFPHGSFLEYGIPVGGSSDNPCATEDVFLAIRTMVTRLSASGEVLGPEQRISVRDALRIYTRGSAYASFDEKRKGSISEGMLADFIIPSDDPFAVEAERIDSIVVDKTYVGGKLVYER